MKLTLIKNSDYSGHACPFTWKHYLLQYLMTSNIYCSKIHHNLDQLNLTIIIELFITKALKCNIQSLKHLIKAF